MYKPRVIKVGFIGKGLAAARSLLKTIICSFKAWVGLQEAGMVFGAEDIIFSDFGDKGEMESKKWRFEIYLVDAKAVS